MAADARITRYIREQMAAGFRKQQIYDALLQAGWYREEVDQAFYEVANQAYAKEPEAAPSEQVSDELHPKKPLPEKLGFFWKLRNALFHPGRLFEGVKNEKGITKPLGFFGILSFIDFIITLLVLLFAPYLFQSLAQNPFLQQVLQYIPLTSLLSMLDPINLVVNYIVIFALTLLGAAAVHLFVFMLRGSKGFHQTYKALMYATAPLIFLSLIFPIFLLTVIVSLDYSLLAIISMGLFVAVGLWSIYIAIKGLSKLHEISVLKAVAALVIIPLIVAIALSFVAFAFLSSFFLGGIFNPSAYIGGSGSATGFGELGLPSQWQYAYDGSFSVALKNNAGVPITINSVTANCGAEGSTIVLETLDPMHLELSGSITYSTGDERCQLKNPGDSYSVSLIVRYLDAGNILKMADGTVTGRIG